jgi:hypothetical protein
MMSIDVIRVVLALALIAVAAIAWTWRHIAQRAERQAQAMNTENPDDLLQQLPKGFFQVLTSDGCRTSYTPPDKKP